MVFNSLAYIVFLAFFVVIYYILPSRYRWISLLFASVSYYLSFIPVFLILLTGIIILNYFLARSLHKLPDNKSGPFMVLIVSLNILLLALFKYYNIFFPDNHVHLYSINLLYPTDPVYKMILPLGLSYLTFTVLSYQIEIRRRNIQPETHLGYFSLYLLFFPKIAQGPIERPQKLIPQFHQNHSFNYTSVVSGLKLILWGYFKKLVVADRLAIYVNAVYNNSEEHNGTTLIIATVFFAFQIYADFSGYTDIALGSAKLFGFNLTNNFKRPYLATTVKEFWDRWHITFSTWLRDYIFLPLAYTLAGKLKKEKYLLVAADKWIYLISIMTTFAVCGIWHGVGWTFLIWGLMYGIYLTYSNWTKDLSKAIRKKLKIKKSSKLYLFYKVIATFILVSFAWIFFRAGSINDAFNIIEKIFTLPGHVFYENPSNLIFALMGISVILLADLKQEYYSGRWLIFNNKYSSIRIASIILFVMIILIAGVFDGGQFIYFQF